MQPNPSQMMFVIFGLFLTCGFIGTSLTLSNIKSSSTQKLWELSLASRSIAMFLWATYSLKIDLLLNLADTLFILSAVCLAVLFKSWRQIPFDDGISQILKYIIIFFISFELITYFDEKASIRGLIVAIVSAAISVWQLYELWRLNPDFKSKILIIIKSAVILQTALVFMTVYFSSIYTAPDPYLLIEKNSSETYFLWGALATHIVIYFFIGFLLYENIQLSENKILLERDAVKDLIDQREKLLSTIITKNRIATSGALSSTLAHEISQPLTSCLLNLGLIKRKVNNIQNSILNLDEFINLLYVDIRRALDLLKNLKAIFSQSNVEKEEFILEEIINEILLTAMHRAKSSNIDINFNSTEKNIIYGAKREIQQTISNIILNAFEALDNHYVEKKRFLFRVVMKKII